MKKAQNLTNTSRFLYFDEMTKLVKCVTGMLRAAPRNYQLDEEIVKLSQNKALWALVTKSLV